MTEPTKPPSLDFSAPAGLLCAGPMPVGWAHANGLGYRSRCPRPSPSAPVPTKPGGKRTPSRRSACGDERVPQVLIDRLFRHPEATAHSDRLKLTGVDKPVNGP